MALEDIEKLREKVERDPNSKLFVPLADEYRKMGMLDEAIAVLQKGLENQPGYMSARVSLGKIYLEKKMLSEAKEEFEKVISTIPDNLYAHKKLAEIYRDIGDKEKAIGGYKTVLKLNPLDDDAVSNLEALQSKRPVESAVQPAPAPPPKEIKPAAAEEILEAVEADILPAEETPQQGSDEEFNQFKKTISERIEGVEGIEGAVPEEIIGEDIISEEEMAEAEKEALNYAGAFKETTAPTAASFETIVKEEKPLVEMPVGKKEDKPAYNLQTAEKFISAGNYSEAMKVYKEMLSDSPQDKYVLQKIEELKMLLKMLGKEQDAVINKLEAFGEGIKKRKDEFFRNT